MAIGPMYQGSFPGDLLPGQQKFFGSTYENWDYIVSRIFETSPEEEQFTQNIILGGFGLPKTKPEDAAFQGDIAAQGWTKFLKQVVYGMSYSLSWEAMMYGHALEKGKMLAQAAKKILVIGREEIGHLILNNATTNANPYLGGDGKPLASTSHVLTLGGSNGANMPAVNYAFSEASMEQADIDISNFLDERGLPMKARPDQLVVPLSKKHEAYRAQNSILRVGTSDNDPNSLREQGIMTKPAIASVYLTSNTQWLCTTNVPNGLICKVKQEPTLEADNESNMLTKNALFIAYMIMVFGWNDWRGVYVNPGS